MKRKNARYFLIALILIIIAISGCVAQEAIVETVVVGSESNDVADDSGSSDTAEDSAEVKTEGESFEEPAGAPAEGEESLSGGDAAPDDTSRDSDEESYETQPTGEPEQGGETSPDQQFNQPLLAGEIDDNEEFDAYLQYRIDFNRFSNIQVHDVDVSERHIIAVVNEDGLPVLGANVYIYDGQYLVVALRTTASGKALFFPRAYPNANASSFEVVVEKDRASQSFTITRSQTDAVWPVVLNASNTQYPVNLDVLFLLDATGSMKEEIRQLQDNILSISAQIEALSVNADVRFGLVHYRDRGDAYVTRTVDFTGNISDFQRELNRVSADGGNDIPESLNEALHEAVNGVNWRVEETVSIIILVADAPPHLDYPQDHDYAEEMRHAAELGIKIHSIGVPLDSWTSGREVYEPQAEYVFRQLAQFTGGHLIMLLSEDSPQSSGDPGTEYGVSEDRYSVEDLDALVVRLIREELEALTGAQ